MLGQAASPAGNPSGLLAGIALIVGALGAALGGLAAVVSAARNRRTIQREEADDDPDYPARLWTELLERLDSSEEAREAETRRADQAEAAYERCNEERLNLLRDRPHRR